MAQANAHGKTILVLTLLTKWKRKPFQKGGGGGKSQEIISRDQGPVFTLSKPCRAGGTRDRGGSTVCSAELVRRTCSWRCPHLGGCEVRMQACWHFHSGYSHANICSSADPASKRAHFPIKWWAQAPGFQAQRGWAKLARNLRRTLPFALQVGLWLHVQANHAGNVGNHSHETD